MKQGHCCMKHRTAVDRTPSALLRERLREAREAIGLSRAQLARRVGVVASAAVQWEQPKGTLPSVSNLLAIAMVTEVSFEWLATGRGHARLNHGGDDPVIHADCFTQDLFEERVLRLVRKIPRAHREPLLGYLETIYPVGR